jgi:hypothetical protein
MPRKPLFSGLVVDEAGSPVGVAYVGDDPCYVIDDGGFLRHVSSQQIDRQVLEQMRGMITGHEDLLSKETARMLGQDDIFSQAMIANQLKNLDQQFETLLETGLPEEAVAYLGMMGFKIIVNVHGEVVEVNQPGGIDPGEDEG